MRSGKELDNAVKYLESSGISLYGINHNPDQVNWTSSPKAYGHIYIDDAAFGCPKIYPLNFSRACVDWLKVGPAISVILDNKES